MTDFYPDEVVLPSSLSVCSFDLSVSSLEVSVASEQRRKNREERRSKRKSRRASQRGALKTRPRSLSEDDNKARWQVVEATEAAATLSVPRRKQSNPNLIALEEETNRYVYVGEIIYEFTAREPIQTYYTFLGNSEVPYPVAVSQTMAYFMLDQAVVPKSTFPPNTDWLKAYNVFYDLPQGQSQPMSSVVKIHGHPDEDLPVRPAVPSEPAK